MSKEHIHITEFDFSLIADFFRHLDRQGPGGIDQTKKALSFTPELDSTSRIADIGCGTCGQTAILASDTEAHITAVDLLPEFIEDGRNRMVPLGFGDRVDLIRADMNDLPFEDSTFDLIWAEGSMYNIGFEKGLREWKRFLKKGGHLAVTDTCWLSDARPAEEDKLRLDHPEIADIWVKSAIIQKCGYMPIAHFILPERCWTENFYDPVPAELERFLQRHENSPVAAEFAERMKNEIEFYMRNRYYYGYVFFIAKSL